MGDRDGERSARVYVGGLTDSVKKEDLETEFEKYGKLNSVWVAFNPPGFAFIEFINHSDAETAWANLAAEGLEEDAAGGDLRTAAAEEGEGAEDMEVIADSEAVEAEGLVADLTVTEVEEGMMEEGTEETLIAEVTASVVMTAIMVEEVEVGEGSTTVLGLGRGRQLGDPQGIKF
ncbi:RRM 1 domain containing protein [Asbolus verrucosus]|uniref:RRM 1 domain containing protein n=1 Tax=Asbolus verrucosus TaxID=1661398 RepID=A0A482W4Q5_ASBVE|nr:RRM 1 domain containing protein [Asbolus verrucosus]